MEISLSVFGEQHPNVAGGYNNIGLVYSNQGDYSKALEYYEKSLEISLSVFGEQHLDVATSCNNIGSVYYRQGDYSKALEYYEKALEIRSSVFGEQHPSVATSYNNIGNVYYNQENYTKALEYYENSLEIQLSIFGEQHLYVATSYNNIGYVYKNQGDYIKALDYYEKAIQVIKNIFGEGSNKVIELAIKINDVYCVELSKSDELKEKYNEFISEYAFTAAIVGEDTPAGKQGMSGEYYLLEYSDWNIESEINLFNVNESLRGLPKDITVMKEGEISRHHFENTIGVALGMKFVGKEKKQRILETYHNWKNSQK